MARRDANLESVIESIFLGINRHSNIGDLRQAQTWPATMMRYMDIPLDENVFELPLFAFSAFMEMCRSHNECKTIAAQLYSCGKTSNYKSLDAIMKDRLSTSFSRHLIEVQVPGTPTIYYATFGTVFDQDLKPLMMLSWIMERKADGDGRIKYHYKRPLLRLNPGICVGKEDTMQRFLSGKLMTTGLSTIITTPYFSSCSGFLEQESSWSARGVHHLKVEIDQSPFIIRGSDTPSISVTNEDLLQLAANHIDEIMQ